MIEEIPAKTILSSWFDGSGWFGANYNMNLYKGCDHGCIYCDSRSECYRIEDFDRVRVKKNAVTLLDRELASRKKWGVVGCGAMSDPYNRFEDELHVARKAFELIARSGFGLTVLTKSARVVRDIDIFREIRAPMMVKITITTPHDALAAKIEPNVSRPSERFAALRALSDAGIICGVLLMPCLPFIEDSPEDILLLDRLAREAGASFVHADFGVTLRANQRDWFYDKLDLYFPGKRELYQKTYQNSYMCGSPRYGELMKLHLAECERLGLLQERRDIIRLFRGEHDRAAEQLTLL